MASAKASVQERVEEGGWIRDGGRQEASGEKQGGHRRWKRKDVADGVDAPVAAAGLQLWRLSAA